MNPALLREIRQKAEEEGLITEKPKFLTRKQREEIAKSKQTQVRSAPTRMEEEYINPATLSASDRENVRKRYFGSLESDKRLRRTGDRRVNFDWDSKDDTSRDWDSQGQGAGTVTTKKAPFPSSRPSVIKSIDASGNEIEIIPDNGNHHMFNEHNMFGGRHRFDDRHWTEKRLEDMEERDWRILKEDFNISTTGSHLPDPLRYWDEAAFPGKLKGIISDIGYEDPTPIQRQSIPVILSGRDLIGIAETGSGKTAAFILPMICHILKLPPINDSNILDGPYGLVLAPTRELALQIEHEANKFCHPLGLHCIAIVGGHSMAEQSVHMRRGVEIVVATPGRLRDCLEQHVLALNQCFSIVLDEADRMIDLNFEEDLNFILSQLPLRMSKPDSDAAENPEKYLQHGQYRQTTMFSATMPPAVEKLARSYLRRPGTITVGQVGRAAKTVIQIIEMIPENEKDRRVLDILKSGDFDPPMIIFVNQKRTVDFLSQRLEALGHRCIALHGGKNQEQREIAISQLKKKNRDILIATDVAGRGIDIKDVSLVVNYDMAKSIEDYIHRIGRTGRMGQTGTAITFLTSDDTELYFDLRVVTQKAPNSVLSAEFLHHEASRTRPGTVIQKKRHEERIFAYGV